MTFWSTFELSEVVEARRKGLRHMSWSERVKAEACGEKGLRQRSLWPGVTPVERVKREVVAKRYACGEKRLWQLWPDIAPAERKC